MGADWVRQRREFWDKIGELNAAANKEGAFRGSAHRENAHRICADELHRQVGWALDKFFETHTAVGASPSDEHRRSCKDWIASRIANAADDLRQHLTFQLQAPPMGSGGWDNLELESRREIESANARIDSAFDALRRNWLERAMRWGSRALRGLPLLR
jgi:hypothetical protein